MVVTGPTLGYQFLKNYGGHAMRQLEPPSHEGGGGGGQHYKTGIVG